MTTGLEENRQPDLTSLLLGFGEEGIRQAGPPFLRGHAGRGEPAVQPCGPCATALPPATRGRCLWRSRQPALGTGDPKPGSGDPTGSISQQERWKELIQEGAEVSTPPGGAGDTVSPHPAAVLRGPTLCWALSWAGDMGDQDQGATGTQGVAALSKHSCLRGSELWGQGTTLLGKVTWQRPSMCGTQPGDQEDVQPEPAQTGKDGAHMGAQRWPSLPGS